MKNIFSFSPDSITVNGWTYAAEYEERRNGSIRIHVTLSTDDHDKNVVILVPADDPRYAAIMAALHPETVPQALAVVPGKAAQQSEPEPPEEGVHESPASDDRTETGADEAQDEPGPKEACGTSPEKSFVGTRIDGVGYSIFFNGEAGRTQIRFTSDASNCMIEAAKAAGFYYSKLTDTFNKRLTFKAYRAALALAASYNAA